MHEEDAQHVSHYIMPPPAAVPALPVAMMPVAMMPVAMMPCMPMVITGVPQMLQPVGTDAPIHEYPPSEVVYEEVPAEPQVDYEDWPPMGVPYYSM